MINSDISVIQNGNSEVVNGLAYVSNPSEITNDDDSSDDAESSGGEYDDSQENPMDLDPFQTESSHQENPIDSDTLLKESTEPLG